MKLRLDPTSPTGVSFENVTHRGGGVSMGMPDASSLTKGKIQLAGDLGGTAAVPLVKRPPVIYVAAYGSGLVADYYCAAATGNQTEINQAIVLANALGGGNGGIVELIGPSFTVSSPIRPMSNVWIRGQGPRQTKIGITSTANNHIVAVDRNVYDQNNPIYNFILSDLELDASGMNPAQSSKCLDGTALLRCRVENVYAHDSTATGLGADDFGGTVITKCYVENCGYVNKRTITAASWSTNTFTFTTSAAHGYTAGSSAIVITGMVPVYYNGRFVVSSTPTSTTFTVNTTDNSGSLNLSIDPGTATTFGYSSDSLIGHNGIGIASGQLTTEATIVSDCICVNNQNNNFLIEADTNVTGPNASYIYTNCISVGAGQMGFLNTGTPNTQFNDCYDYGSTVSFQMSSTSQTRTITAASWSGGTATFTTSTAHGYSATGAPDGVPKKVEITGMTPSAYNGYYTVTGTPSSTTFTVAITSDPGTATVFGTSSYVFHNPYDSSINDCISTHALNWGIRLPTHSDGVMVKDTTIKYSYNYGIQFNSSRSQFSGLRVHDNGRQGIYISSPNNNIVPLTHNDISDSSIWNNGTRGIASGGNGIEIDPGTGQPISYLTMSNIQTWDDQDTATQNYGIIIRNGGSLSNISINGGNLSGATQGYLNQDTTDAVAVSNVVGINPSVRKAFGSTSGSLTFDSSTANYFTLTMTGNVTAVMPNAVVPNATMTWVLTQDSTGGRTISLPANASVWTSLTLSSAASAVDTLNWAYDSGSSKWRLVSRFRGSALPVAEGGTGATTITGLVKGNGTSAFTAATSGTDYAPATSGSGILKGNGSGGFSTATADTDYTTPTGTETLTNKRITPRINSTASSATPAINTDTTDQFNITALATAITSMTTNLSGTPTDGQKLLIRIKDNGTARAITWGASFTSSGIASLPATTVISKTHLIGLIYDSVAALWVCMAADSAGY